MTAKCDLLAISLQLFVSQLCLTRQRTLFAKDGAPHCASIIVDFTPVAVTENLIFVIIVLATITTTTTAVPTTFADTTDFCQFDSKLDKNACFEGKKVSYRISNTATQPLSQTWLPVFRRYEKSYWYN